MSFKPIYKLLDWIPIEKLNKPELSFLEKSIDFISKNKKFIHWKYISSNSNAISLIDDYFLEYNKCKKKNIKINFEWLSENENAIHILKKYKKRINWKQLSFNKNAILLLKNNLDKVSWRNLSSNENAIEILENNLDKIDWNILSGNKNAIEILKKNFDKINWEYLSENENAVELLNEYQDKIDYEYLCNNPNSKVIPLIFKNISKINFSDFCLRKEPEIILYIEKNFIDIIEKDWNNLDSICKNKETFYLIEQNLDYLINKHSHLLWHSLSENENALELLKINKDKINWNILSSNEGIFILDTKSMMEKCKPFAEELTAYVFHPNRIKRFSEKYKIDFDIYLEIY